MALTLLIVKWDHFEWYFSFRYVKSLNKKVHTYLKTKHIKPEAGKTKVGGLKGYKKSKRYFQGMFKNSDAEFKPKTVSLNMFPSIIIKR